MSAKIEISGPGGAQEIVLDAGNTWRIGRSNKGHVTLEDDLVSRRHAMLQRTENGEYYLVDLGSRNGTFVNGHRVSTPRVLKDGDEIALGAHTLKFIYAHAQPEVPLPAMGDLSLSRTQALFRSELISVLVVDVVGYTRMAQQIEQNVLCQVIGTWFRHAGQIMQQYGSWTLKYIGDAVMTIWIHRTPGAEAEEILSMLRALHEFACVTATLAAEYRLERPVLFGAGINTGLATIGNTGTGDHSDYTAMGDAVNAAFRIEGCTRYIGHDLVIGEGTYTRVRPRLTNPALFTHRMVELKGYDQPAPVWAGSLAEIGRLFAAAAGSQNV